MKITAANRFGPPPPRRIVFGEPEFRAAAIERFPELRDELLAETGRIHVQMGVLARAARVAIEEDNAERFERIANFLNETLLIPNLDPEIDNAICISFLGAGELRATEAGRGAWHRLPPTIRERLTEYERRLNEALLPKKGKHR